MMALGYHVQGESLTGTAPAGIQHLGLTVGHLSFAHAPAITGVHARVSFDAGHTWQNAHVTGRGNSYQATFPAAAGGYPTLQVTATDAAGGSVTETIIRAYRIAGTAMRSAGAACSPVGSNRTRCLVILSPATGKPGGWGAAGIRSASPAITEVTIGRAGKTGQSNPFSFFAIGQVPSKTRFFVAPVTGRVSVGQLYYVYSRLFSPSAAGTPGSANCPGRDSCSIGHRRGGWPVRAGMHRARRRTDRRVRRTAAQRHRCVRRNAEPDHAARFCGRGVMTGTRFWRHT
jgi:hypothetical protein